jgi:hypothetical protein
MEEEKHIYNSSVYINKTNNNYNTIRYPTQKRNHNIILEKDEDDKIIESKSPNNYEVSEILTEESMTESDIMDMENNNNSQDM